MRPLLSLLARCRPPATGRDTHARRNLPTTTPAGSASLVPASTPLADPPALAVPVSPQQSLTRSSITAALRSEAAGGQGPPTAHGCVPAFRCVTKPMLTRWRGRHGGRGATHRSCGSFWGRQPQGTVWQEQERWFLGMPDAAGRSHRVHLQRVGGTVAPRAGVSPPRHPSSVAQGAAPGSGAALGAFNPGSTLASSARSRRRSPCTSWAISQSLVSGGGQGHSILHGRSSGHASGLRTAAQGWGSPLDLPGELRGRRAGASPQHKHQRKTL